MKLPLATASLIAVSHLVLGHADAQCTPQWQPAAGVPGIFGGVSAMAWWDPDGVGPLAPRVVVAGSFSVAGNVVANRIATWDPATGVWSALGAGMDESVLALAVMPNGDLIAGGSFTTAGGVAANRLARWTGTTWAQFAGGVTFSGGYATIQSMAVLPNGNLVDGGTFTAAGGVAALSVARWN
ncbi:MAG: hypothetical protein ACK5BN_12155, partial [Planctomycetota bacterium]